jgi:DNA-binding MarR family transcriptional regulator
VSVKSDLCVDILASVRAIGWLRKRSAGAAYGDEINLLATLATVRELDGARISTVAERLAVDLSAISRRVATLRARGWVESVPDPDDRRAQLVTLSPSGAALLTELRTSTGEALAKGLGEWTVADLTALADLLKRFEGDLSALTPGTGTAAGA